MVSRMILFRILPSPNIQLLVLCTIAGMALLVSWWRVRTLRQSPTVLGSITLKLPLFITTASYLFFLVCLAFPPALGSDYSGRMSATIGINFGVALLMLILSLVRKSSLRWTVAAAALALALIWVIIAAVSSAV
jgi:hypothetical protein